MKALFKLRICGVSVRVVDVLITAYKYSKNMWSFLFSGDFHRSHYLFTFPTKILLVLCNDFTNLFIVNFLLHLILILSSHSHLGVWLNLSNILMETNKTAAVKNWFKFYQEMDSMSNLLCSKVIWWGGKGEINPKNWWSSSSQDLPPTCRLCSLLIDKCPKLLPTYPYPQFVG